MTREKAQGRNKEDGGKGNGNLLQHLRHLTFVLRRYSQAAQQIPTPSSALVPGRRGTQKPQQQQQQKRRKRRMKVTKTRS